MTAKATSKDAWKPPARSAAVEGAMLKPAESVQGYMSGNRELFSCPPKQRWPFGEGRKAGSAVHG